MTDWMMTFTGRPLVIADPDPRNIVIEDIAHGLAQICRWGGQCRWFFSVAQHSLLVSQHVPKEDALAALLHDASEAYLGDCIRPLKAQLPDYRAIERRWERTIAEAFDLPSLSSHAISLADHRAMVTERRDLFAADAQWRFDGEPEPFSAPIFPMGVEFCKNRFLGRFYELRQARALKN